MSFGVDLGHRAHYYGPYSRDVELALAQTALAGEVDETMERYPSFSYEPDVRKYTYVLSDSGRREVESVHERIPDAFEKVRLTVDAVHEAVPEFNQKTLSMAAKIHFIVNQQQVATPLTDIPVLAKKLGWRISDDQVSKSVALLKNLGLLSVA